MRVPKDLLERVDAARGHESRASFVKRAIREAVLPPKLVTPEGGVTISDHSGQIEEHLGVAEATRGVRSSVRSDGAPAGDEQGEGAVI
jgi:hypothetical protein